MHDNIILATLDAVEIAEILEYFLEHLDVLADNDLATLLFADCSPYGLDAYEQTSPGSSTASTQAHTRTLDT
jgi:hypothetical protein